MKTYKFNILYFTFYIQRSWLALLFTFYISHFTCLYGKGAGTTVSTVMMHTFGARQMSLGGCGASINNDIYSLYFNPAGLHKISENQMSSLFSSGLSNDYKASVVYVHPLNIQRESVIAFGVFHLNGGIMEINYVDGTSEDVVSQSDFLATIGWGGYLSKNTSIGYNIKYLSTKLAEKYSTSAIAFDAGVHMSVTKRLNMGVSAQNYGTSLKYRSEKESLPFLARGGISYQLPLADSHSVLTVVDGFYLVKEKDIYGSAGIEYSIHQKYFLRGGCKILPDRNDFTLGAGLIFKEKFSVDWATELSVLNNPHNISFSMRFGGAREDKVRKKGREEKTKIWNLAVADFVGKNVSQADASIVTDFIRTELVKIGRFNVVEKANMNEILSEAAFQQTGCTTAECAVQIGKILNVQQMIVGSLSKLMDTYFITLNLVDVETGKIVKSDNIKAYSAEELQSVCKTLANKLIK
ncbi:MAG: PorV/PorQ family protein [Elusimicrobia bacterium]|nr:PorV/PorQ family protein [Elusimicrobiota bacterium]